MTDETIKKALDNKVVFTKKQQRHQDKRIKYMNKLLHLSKLKEKHLELRLHLEKIKNEYHDSREQLYNLRMQITQLNLEIDSLRPRNKKRILTKKEVKR